MTAPATKRAPDADLRAALMMTLALTVVRVFVLFRTPLELHPDEAQYWLWSRTLAFGYHSEPPMVAWTIWATTHLGGDAEPWVRLAAPLLQGGATLLVFAIGRRLYGGAAALAAAALYALVPAIQLSASVIATDAPLLFFLGLSILAYVALQPAQGRARLLLAAGLGAALGLAFLSEYAAVYAVIGVALHLALSREARRAWTPASAILCLASLGAVLAPNLGWNAAHGFATLRHTLANANWAADDLMNGAGLARFLGAQLIVFGPIPLGALMVGGALAARRRRIEPADLLLLCFILPPLAIVSVQSFVSRAHANGSGASYLPGAVLAAAWLMRWRARRWLAAALVLQGLAAALFVTIILAPRTAEPLGLASAFKRAKGWSQTTQLILDRAREERGQGLSAIAVNNRFLYYSVAYYGRDFFRDPLNPPLRAWTSAGAPQNQAKASAPLTPADGQRVLAAADEGWFRDQMAADFTKVSGPEIDSVTLDRKHKRRVVMFIGEGFRPRPRPPVSVRTTPP
ncbi:4-amino-4-deoxy-L-arabinose transferase [Phenylobacterium hankyongense]|uniref:4-amino-4-deoxy-L-arabinose transferase n=1 Tax=Phenylobacterium hankyongense TaxID=1813876 RepID=A0A328AYZ8_9CAUL|nr:glycosyltransferase family 39 protein [Phenylobacterium hankyongense]RAK59817.1 4-amino-4-deoxy-L-arabinose transferase [Phenylobacterium hankyongense]